MPRFAANLSMMYGEHAFLDRFAAAAKDGFDAVEYLFPYEFQASEIAKRLADHGLQQALFNAPPGDWAAGERGLACLPGRGDEFRSGVLRAIDYAHALRCPRIHLMAGLQPKGHDRASLRDLYVENLAWAAEQDRSIEFLIEPINTRDIPGFFLNRQDHAHEVVQLSEAPNLRVQMDLYHCQIVEGDLAVKLKQYLPSGRVGHIQIAGVPERHEPDLGEVNYPYLFALIDSLGYAGVIGAEYRPRAGTSAGLGWFKPYQPQKDR
ncbi:MAG: hydroxypyruvate isomerase family protein [Piscinibacter sp.]